MKCGCFKYKTGIIDQGIEEMAVEPCDNCIKKALVIERLAIEFVAPWRGHQDQYAEVGIECFKGGHASRDAEVAELLAIKERLALRLHADIQSLQTKLDVAMGALKFYGDERNWDRQDTFAGRISLKEENDDIRLVGFEQDDSEEVGGRRAFEALSTINEEKMG